MSTNSLLAKVAIPYAEALFNSSKFLKSIKKNSDELKFIGHMIAQSYSLENFLANPLVVPKAKKKVIETLFTDQISVQVLNFLFILIERRRIVLLNSIIDTYLTLVYKLELTTVVDVYSAVILTEIQKKTLEEKLQIMTNSKEIRLVIYIRPALIGGFVIKIGSKFIDMSISGQLNQIASHLNVVSL